MTHNAVFAQDQAIGLLLDPLDVLFFRDGRPFEAASRGYGGLPMPQTLMGMIMEHIRGKLGIESKDIHGMRNNAEHTHRWTANVAVRGPWFVEPAEDGESVKDLFLPAPAHLVGDGDNENPKLQLLAPMRNSDFLPGWNPPRRDGDELRPLVAAGPVGKSKGEAKWLNKDGLESILNGVAPDPAGLVKSSSVYTYEDRTGIAVDHQKGTAEDGMIYGARFLRLEKKRMLYAEVGIEPGSGINLIEDTKKLRGQLTSGALTLKFGGEARRVRVTVVKPFDWPKAPDSVPSTEEGGFSTILVSPVIFTCRDGSNSTPRMPPCVGKLVGAAVPKPLAISGWAKAALHEGDPTTNAPRSTRYAAPAGTVYFWQNGKNADSDRPHPTMYSLAHDPRNRAAGWGVALRGAWKFHDTGK